MEHKNNHECIDQHARDLGNRVLARLQRHEEICTHMRRSQQQWQESSIRILQEMKVENARQSADINEKIATHSLADLKFQEDIYNRIGGWNKFLIRVLMSVVGGCFVIIGAFTWHALFTH